MTNIEKKLKTELERRRLVNYEVRSKIIIREGEVKEYYEAHKDEFSTKGKVHLAMIFLKQDDPADREESRALKVQAGEIIQNIEAGEDFGKLARQFSNGPGAKEGGDLGVFKISELNPEMAATIKDLSSGEVGVPIVGPNGIQIIKVVEKDKGGGKIIRPGQKFHSLYPLPKKDGSGVFRVDQRLKGKSIYQNHLLNTQGLQYGSR